MALDGIYSNNYKNRGFTIQRFFCGTSPSEPPILIIIKYFSLKQLSLNIICMKVWLMKTSSWVSIAQAESSFTLKLSVTNLWE